MGQSMNAALAGPGAFDVVNHTTFASLPFPVPQGKILQIPYLEVNSQFMKDFTNLKIETGQIHPQYNNIAFVDKIVKVASNNMQEVGRHASKPQFFARPLTT